MKRSLQNHLLEYAQKKIILLSGPRQVGKTTLAKKLLKSFAYYNYDSKEDLGVFTKNQWDTTKELVIFDELHKKKNWKLWLKGIYDSGVLNEQKILVTGSARLDVARKVGDSLAGRFFSYRLNPLDLKELKGYQSREKNYTDLLNYSGFPEPFFEANKKFYGLWKKTHSDLILRQDLLSLEVVKDLDSLEVLIELLSERVGSTISYNSLAQDLQKDEKTIKKWLTHLENLYVVFRLNPYSKNIGTSIKKAGKYYFYDLAKVRGISADQKESAQLENLVALALKKEIEFQSDVYGRDLELRFIKFKDQKEIDFVVLADRQVSHLIEVKMSDTEVSGAFLRTEKFLLSGEKIQLVKNLKKAFTSKDGVQVLPCLEYLENLKL